MSKYGVISSPYFPVFKLNTRKYGPEVTPYLDTFHVVRISETGNSIASLENKSSEEDFMIMQYSLKPNLLFAVGENFFIKDVFKLSFRILDKN